MTRLIVCALIVILTDTNRKLSEKMNKSQFIKQTAKNLNTSEQTIIQAMENMRLSGTQSAAQLTIEVGLIDNKTQTAQNNRKFWQLR